MKFINHLPFNLSVGGLNLETVAPVPIVKYPNKCVCSVVEAEVFGEPAPLPDVIHIVPLQVYHILVARRRQDIATVTEYLSQPDWEGKAEVAGLLMPPITAGIVNSYLKN